MTPSGFDVLGVGVGFNTVGVGVGVNTAHPETGRMSVPSSVQLEKLDAGMSVLDVLVLTSVPEKYQAWQSHVRGVVMLAVRTVRTCVPALGVVTLIAVALRTPWATDWATSWPELLAWVLVRTVRWLARELTSKPPTISSTTTRSDMYASSSIRVKPESDDRGLDTSTADITLPSRRFVSWLSRERGWSRQLLRTPSRGRCRGKPADRGQQREPADNSPLGSQEKRQARTYPRRR